MSDDPPATPDYRFHHAVDVRFRDLDPMGHAHHGMPLVYLEEARAAYWRDVTGQSGLDGIDYVMAEVTVRYHRRIEYPNTLDIAVRTSHISAKSFVMEFEVRSTAGELMSSGRTVQVMYDYAAGASKPVPPALRHRLTEYDGL